MGAYIQHANSFDPPYIILASQNIAWNIRQNILMSHFPPENLHSLTSSFSSTSPAYNLFPWSLYYGGSERINLIKNAKSSSSWQTGLRLTSPAGFIIDYYAIFILRVENALGLVQ